MTSKASGNALVLGVVLCFTVVVAACTAIFISNPDGDNVTQLVTILLGSLGSTVAVLATLAKVSTMDQKVDYLANGGTDAKIRAGLADIIRPEFLRDDITVQIAEDRIHRAAGPSAPVPRARKPH